MRETGKDTPPRRGERSAGAAAPGLSAVAFLALALCACSLSTARPPAPYALNEAVNETLNPEETFTVADSGETFTVGGVSVTGPWGYARAANANRLYPLLVSGFWGDGKNQYTASVNSFNKRYPAFVLDWQKDGVGDGEALADWIDLAVSSGYRVDPSRVYLTGFSRGGSGSFPLARGMGNKGKYFAAILRVAGQSQSDLGDGIAAKTALWYHVGLNDEPARVSVARAALANFRAYPSYANAVEASVADETCGVPRSTVTLSRAGEPTFRYSEYTGMGHESGTCYRDRELFVWLFNRRLR